MGREGITLEQVEGAVSALEERGEKVTYQSVRNEAGGGCYTTIGKHLRALQKRDAVALAMTGDVPSAVASRFTSLIGQLWHEAQAVAAQDVEALRRGANARVAIAETSLDQVAEQLDATLNELEGTNERLAEVEKQLRSSEQANAKLQGENDAMAKQFSALNSSLESEVGSLRLLIEQSTGKSGKAAGPRRKEPDKA